MMAKNVGCLNVSTVPTSHMCVAVELGAWNTNDIDFIPRSNAGEMPTRIAKVKRISLKKSPSLWTHSTRTS